MMMEFAVFKRIAPYVIAVAVVLGGLYFAYDFGVDTDRTRSDLVIAKMGKDAAEAKTKAEQDARDVEQQHVADMAALDAKYTKEISDAKIISDRNIADLSNGNLGLRKQLAAVKLYTGKAGSTSTSASVGDAAYGPGLRIEDAQFLLREAARADGAVRQLSACQDIVSKDRK